MAESNDTLYALDEADPLWVSVSGMQCGLRSLFASKPVHRAAAMALEEFGTMFEADYAVMHARFGAMPLSEEWSRSDFALSEQLREQVNEAMVRATDHDEPRCIRLGGNSGSIAIMATVLYGENAEQAGCLALLFRDCSRAQAYEILVQVESLAGFLSLLLSDRTSGVAGRPQSRDVALPSAEPLRMMLEMVGELRNRHELDQVAIGVVDGSSVAVAVVNDTLDLRPSNPGVRSIRNAMIECLDAREPIRLGEDGGGPAYRLHGSWRRDRGGGVVASVPLLVDDSIVAIVTVATSHETSLSDETLQELQSELGQYASLLPIARMATRSWVHHTKDVISGGWQRLRRRGRRFALLTGLGAAALGWLAFGTIPYRITVPCVVKAVGRRVVSSPRGGVLSELYVRPGDQVHRGQLIAELDSHEDRLTKAELEADLLAIDAQIDVALGEGDSGGLRVLEAQRNGLLAKISVVARRIEQAQIRAPLDGILLAGELREKLGARLSMGEAMFEVARSDGALVQMNVPEQLVIAARGSNGATFIASATPDTEYELLDFRLAPASTIIDGSNVFVAEAELAETTGWLPPGMEGFAVIEAGPRQASWVLTHRLLDWMRLNFWL